MASVSAAAVASGSASSDCEARCCARCPSNPCDRHRGDLCPATQAAGQGSVHCGPRGCHAHREGFFGARLESVARIENYAHELLFLGPLLGPHGLVKLCYGYPGSPELFLGLWVQGRPCALLAQGEVQEQLHISCMLKMLMHHQKSRSS